MRAYIIFTVYTFASNVYDINIYCSLCFLISPMYTRKTLSICKLIFAKNAICVNSPERDS